MKRLENVLTKCKNSIDEIGIRSLLLIAAIIFVLSSTILHNITPIPIVHIGNAIIYALFLTVLLMDREKLKDRRLRAFVFAMTLFLVVGSIGRLIYGGNLIQYFWSLRNYLRFYLLFIDCYVLFDERHIKYLVRLFDCVVAMHILITLIQFFVIGINWDYLNGFFGSEMGGGVQGLMRY